MARKVIPLVTGETYHIYNRGVDKRIVFNDKVDFFRFHQSMQLFNSLEQSGSIYELCWKEDWIDNQIPLVRIHAYCLLNNHFHLLLTQVTDGGISEFMKRLGGGYTSYFNERHERSGALFQGKFKRVHCSSNEKLLHLATYINLNNKVHSRGEYYLSSFDAYLGKREESFVYTDLVLGQYKNIRSFERDSIATTAEISRQRTKDKEYEKGDLLE